jgi:hypothetical protein
MLISARFGATQLLESTGKILQYSRVSGQSTLASESRPAKEPYMPGLDNRLPDQDADQDRGDILHVSQRPGEKGTASGHTDLIGLSEEIVEDVSKRMRLSDTIMIIGPVSGRRGTNGRGHISSRGQPEVCLEGEGVDEGYSSVILFDARSVDNCQVSSNGGIRIILENLSASIFVFGLARKGQFLT